MASTYATTNAEGYELHMGRWSPALAEPFLDFADLGPAGRVLDVGCGTGSLTRAIAARVNGDVLGVDVSAPFIGHARASNRNARISYEVHDASKPLSHMPHSTPHFRSSSSTSSQSIGRQRARWFV